MKDETTAVAAPLGCGRGEQVLVNEVLNFQFGGHLLLRSGGTACRAAVP